MSEEVYRAVAQASSGYVEAPAGCGKTEAIVKTVGTYCTERQLVLTHTHAGVDALRQRFRRYQVRPSRYHVDTIAGWAWGWVRKFPENAVYTGSTEIAAWNDVYAAMVRLMQRDFVRQGVLNSYAGIIVDEYQDCTVPMHALIIALKAILPCRILGDPLQGIFEFGGQQLIGWPDVEAAFATDLGALDTPHRWIKSGNEGLGAWLLKTRAAFHQGREPDFRGGPIERKSVTSANLGSELVSLTHEKQGRLCIIGPKARPLPRTVETALVNKGYVVLEPNELTALREILLPLSDGTPRQKTAAAVAFFKRAYGGLTTENPFIEDALRGRTQRPRRPDRKALARRHKTGTTPHLVLDLLHHVGRLGGVCRKRPESISALKCILEAHIETGADLKSLYAEEIAKRKYQSRSRIYRCTGSTLLVKGLEFDHAVIVRGQNWGTAKDLYVALTRGTKSTTLLELAA